MLALVSDKEQAEWDVLARRRRANTSLAPLFLDRIELVLERSSGAFSCVITKLTED